MRCGGGRMKLHLARYFFHLSDAAASEVRGRVLLSVTMERTRKCFKCPLLGELCDIKDNVLPTYEDVIKYYEWTRREAKFNRSSHKEPTFLEIADIVAKKIEGIWIKASLPTVTHARVCQMLKSYHLKYKNLLKSHPKIPQKNIDEFQRNSKALFDICSCKCKDLNSCVCSKERKVPTNERIFLIDQRISRKMIIGNVDVTSTNQLRKSLKRKHIQQQTAQNKTTDHIEEPIELLNTSSSSITNDSDWDDPVVVVKVPTTSQQVCSGINFSALSKTCDRFGISDRAGAAIASVVLQATESAPVIDKNKLRRERTKTRQSIMSKDKVQSIPALYFDGRKDRTLTMIKQGAKYYRKTILEEHISLIKEPGSIYLGHITPTTGTSKMIVKEITQYFLNQNLCLSDLLAIGCDGTNVNVGKYGGIIRLLEKQLNKPLQWIVCLLHMNELPFRHLFAHIDGATSGPNTFSGKIGKELENCEMKPVIQYQAIPSELPHVTAQDLSTDQSYLHSITSAISTGVFPEDLAKKSPGKMSHARWLTRANRILRLYVSTKSPSEELSILATYVVRVYAPTWFAIKTHPSCKDGARHLWKLISASRYLTANLKAVIDPVITRNGYFAHPENILLAMLTDPQKHIRELAARRILKARTVPATKLRCFQVPNLDFNASSYVELIDWQKNITQPPILKSVSDEELQLFIAQKGEGELLFLRLPSHTQAVERAVKTVTEAASILCNKSAREGFIKSQIESRKDMPKFDSKKDFRVV